MRRLIVFSFILMLSCSPKTDDELIIGSWDLISYQMDANSDPMSIEPGSPASYTYTFDEGGTWSKGEETGSYSIDLKRKKITIKGEIPDLGPYSKKWDYKLSNDSLSLSSMVKEDLITSIYIKKAGSE